MRGVKPARARTHYDTLRVARGASAEDVRLAYRRLAQKYHPDRHPAGDHAASTMAGINSAYGVLSDSTLRAKYDADLHAGELRTTAARERIASIDVPTLSRSSWVLLFVIAAFTMTTLAFVTLYTIAPRQVRIGPPHPTAAAQAVQPADNTPLAPLPAVEAWKEPPPSQRVVNAATDPVTRLVRDGVLPARPATANPNRN